MQYDLLQQTPYRNFKIDLFHVWCSCKLLICKLCFSIITIENPIENLPTMAMLVDEAGIVSYELLHGDLVIRLFLL